MKDFFSLKVIDLFKGVYKSFGIDYEKMRLIVGHKLILDTRRSSNLTNNNDEDDKKNYFKSSLIIYTIMGAVTSPLVLINIEPMIKMSIYFSFFMVMMLAILISDFSTVILDVNDKDIIGTKGVDLKTINAAKVTHVFIYIFMLSFAIALIPIAFSIKFGVLYFILFILNIILVDVFIIVVTAIMYLVILRLFKGEKLKDIINGFQILFILAFSMGGQIVGQSFNIIDIKVVYVEKIWNIFVPPMWFASTFTLINGAHGSDIIQVLRILAFIVPLVSIIVYVKLTPVFERSLQKLNDNTYKNKRTKKQLYFKVGSIICREKEEKVFFNFTYEILQKDREFKTKVYPSLAMVLFMPVILIFVSYNHLGILNYIESLKGSPMMLMSYFTIVISQSIIIMTKHSKEHEAAWVYDVFPIKEKGYIYSGMFKASICKLILPIFIGFGIVFSLVFGVKSILHLVIMFTVLVLSSMLTFHFNEKVLPFSVPHTTASNVSNITVFLKTMLVVGILGGIHYLLFKKIIFSIIYLIVLALVIKIIWKKVFMIGKYNKSL